MEEEIKAEFLKSGFTLDDEEEILKKCEFFFIIIYFNFVHLSLAFIFLIIDAKKRPQLFFFIRSYVLSKLQSRSFRSRLKLGGLLSQSVI